MKLYPTDSNGRQLFEYKLKALLGIPLKLPADFSRHAIYYGGFVFRVLSTEQAKLCGKFHRVEQLCPVCEVFIPAGRMQQHKCRLRWFVVCHADATWWLSWSCSPQGYKLHRDAEAVARKVTTYDGFDLHVVKAINKREAIAFVKQHFGKAAQ